MSGGDELKKIGLGQTLSRNVSRNLAKVSMGLLAGIGLLAAGWAQTPDVATPTPLIDQQRDKSMTALTNIRRQEPV